MAAASDAADDALAAARAEVDRLVAAGAARGDAARQVAAAHGPATSPALPGDGRWRFRARLTHARTAFLVGLARTGLRQRLTGGGGRILGRSSPSRAESLSTARTAAAPTDAARTASRHSEPRDLVERLDRLARRPAASTTGGRAGPDQPADPGERARVARPAGSSRHRAGAPRGPPRRPSPRRAGHARPGVAGGRGPPTPRTGSRSGRERPRRSPRARPAATSSNGRWPVRGASPPRSRAGSADPRWPGASALTVRCAAEVVSRLAIAARARATCRACPR